MTIDAHLLARGTPATDSPTPLFGSLGSLSRWVAGWLRDCADHWSAAALYDSLNGLSDAELHRLGLARDTLARDALEASRDRISD